jgi:diguanylate cyclase (GGDEF)-like protein
LTFSYYLRNGRKDDTREDVTMADAEREDRALRFALDGVRAAGMPALDALPVSPGGNRWQIVEDPTPGVSWPIRQPGGRTVAHLVAPEDLAADAIGELRPIVGLLEALLGSELRAVHASIDAAEALAAAMSDQMTGLPNVRAWRQALRREERRCARSSARAAIAMIDLDDLKVVNDTQGHLAGDILLRVAADALSAAVRGTDIVARLGGDEFGVLAVDYEPDNPGPLLDRINKHLAEADVRASVGAEVHLPEKDIMRTAHLADVAMYDEKRRRKSLVLDLDAPEAAVS